MLILLTLGLKRKEGQPYENNACIIYVYAKLCRLVSSQILSVIAHSCMKFASILRDYASSLDRSSKILV